MRIMAGVKVPDIITDERGRLLDMIADMHQYVYGKRVALFGDPDQLVSLWPIFLSALDMKPVYIVTGTPSTRFEKRIRRVLDDSVPDGEDSQRSAGRHAICCTNGSSRNLSIC